MQFRLSLTSIVEALAALLDRPTQAGHSADLKTFIAIGNRSLSSSHLLSNRHNKRKTLVQRVIGERQVDERIGVGIQAEIIIVAAKRVVDAV